MEKRRSGRYSEIKWHYISVFRGKWSSGSLKKRFLDTVKRSLIVFSSSGKRHRFTNKYTSRYKSISWRLELSKSTWGEQPVEDILIFACISLYLFLYVLMYVTPPDQTKNDTDPQFGTHTPIDHIKKLVFYLFNKIILRTASLEKLTRHVDYPHISSITLMWLD